MVGFLNEHGTCNVVDGTFLDFSIVEDDDVRTPRNWVGFGEATTDDSPITPEPFDPRFEETTWSTMLLGEDCDHNENSPLQRNIARWLSKRYGTVIELNGEIGYTPVLHVEQTTRATDTAPSFHGLARMNIRPTHWADRSSFRRNNPDLYDKLRGKAHAK